MKFIDIHAHANAYPQPPYSPGKRLFSTPGELLAFYDRYGVEKGVILPAANVENTIGVQSNEEAIAIAAAHPDRFIPFCDVDPRAFFNAPDAPLLDILKWYRDKGCRGLGEICANLPFSDPRVQNLFAAAEAVGFPVTFHVSPVADRGYGLVDQAGLPGIESSLARFPKLRFFGHSQAFWCEIGRYADEACRAGYPEGPVVEGRLPALFRDYPNLYGDLSAGSGANALMRDRVYAIKFLTEFQDRLLFGLDICSPEEEDVKPHRLPAFLRELRATGEISDAVFRKVGRENAERLLGLG